MPVHVEELVSDVVVVGEDLPLAEAHIEKLVGIVLRRLSEERQAEASTREATQIRGSVAPRLRVR
jgi:hypothetical protein